MEEQEKGILDYLKILNRRKGLVLGIMSLITAASLVLAFTLPPVYKSTSTILIEQQEVPQDFVRTLVTSFAEQRIQVISQKILSTSNLVPLIEKYDIYAEAREINPIESVVGSMRENIKLEMVSAEVIDPKSGQARSATIAFTLSFEDQSPKLAQNVTNELTTLFLEENIKSRAKTAIEASAFLGVEAEKLSTILLGLEQKLATFKKANSETLPELNQMNMNTMNRTEQEVHEAKRRVTTLEERLIFLTGELALQPETIDEERYNPAYDIQRQKYEMSLQRHQFKIQRDQMELQRRTRIGELQPDTRLEALQSEYLASVSKYSAGHPDVQRLKREIDSLQTTVGGSSSNTTLIDSRIANLGQTLSSARERYSSDHPDVRRYERELKELESQRNTTVAKFKPRNSTGGFPGYNVTEPQYLTKIKPNPAHIQLKAQIDAVKNERISLDGKLAELGTKLSDYQLRVAQTPQVEREYRDLTRDFDTATKKYQDITAKILEAKLAESLETQQKGEKFTLIEPPVFPEEPFKPNRLAIVFLGLMLSFAGGLGAATLAEAFNDSVRGRQGVIEMLGEPPLAMVPFITTLQDVRKKVIQRSLLAFGTIASILVVAALVHLYYMPLDVLWFKSIRQAGM